MQSSLIGKIEKANRYALETDRITFSEFTVNFRGENNTYSTGFKDKKWQCSCQFFSSWGLCSHTMALEKIMGNMLPSEAINTQYDPTAEAV
jgi:hypothetical protein